MARILELRVHKLKCIHHTTDRKEVLGIPFETDPDSIDLSGTITDLNSRRVHNIPKLFLGNRYRVIGKPGEPGYYPYEESFSPARTLIEIELNENDQYPKPFAISLIMAEKDDGGGLDTFIRELSTRAAREIGDVISRRTDFDENSPELWRLCLQILGSVFSSIFSEIGSALGLGDDIFPPQMLNLVLSSPNSPFNGSDTTPVQTVKFFEPGYKAYDGGTKHLGEYELYYDWHVRTGSLNSERVSSSSQAISLPPQFRVTFPSSSADCKAWVWANQPESASYIPSTYYQYNSSGGTNQIVRLGVGQYRVELPNLGTPSGMVHVSAYNGKHFCKVVSWNPSGSTQQIRVNCLSPDGKPVDGQFVLLFYKETRGAAWTNAYLWANQPTSAFYTPSPAYQWNSKGLTNTVRRLNVGHYEVTLSGMNILGGTVLVSAYGQGTERCKVGGWYPSGNDTIVTVYCFDINGNPVDTMYTLSFMTDVGLGAQGLESQQKGGYVWADQPTAGTYTPNALYQMNTSGIPNTITRVSIGSYIVHFPKLAAFSSTTAMVTTYGSGSEYGTVQWWTGDGNDGTNVSVQCFDRSGNLVDTQFDLTYLTDDRILQ